jgi:hypothetical protein
VKSDRQMEARIPVSDNAIDVALEQLSVKIKSAMRKHGNQSFLSAHEVIGTIREELHEAEMECFQNNLVGFSQEVLDIAVVCVFAHACRLEFNRSGKSSEDNQLARSF